MCFGSKISKIKFLRMSGSSEIYKLTLIQYLYVAIYAYNNKKMQSTYVHALIHITHAQTHTETQIKHAHKSTDIHMETETCTLILAMQYYIYANNTDLYCYGGLHHVFQHYHESMALYMLITHMYH